MINKIDRPDARCEEVVDEVLDLLDRPGAPTRARMDSPIVYVQRPQGHRHPGTGAARPGPAAARSTPSCKYIPAPEGDVDGPAQVLISTIDYNEYVGRIGVGRITRGVFRYGMNVIHTNHGTRQ